MRRAAGRMRIRVENLIQELHRQEVRFLVDSFDVILLPTFEASVMVERGRRRIRSKTVRNLLSLAHYRFGMFLRHKASDAGVAVLGVNEAYTIETVSWTGELLDDVGGATVITGGDGERMDSDYNGARGIYLRAGRLPATVRRERDRLTSQRKYEDSRVSACPRKLIDIQHSSTNFYRIEHHGNRQHTPREWRHRSLRN